MKLTLGLTAALAGCAAAAQQAAHVYMFRGDADSHQTTATPSITPSLARLILLQRVSPLGKGPSVAEIPENVDDKTVADLMNQFGGPSESLFEDDTTTPSQALILIEGLTDSEMKEMDGKFGMGAAFTISAPPASSAHDSLLKNDIYNAGIASQHSCSISQVLNPFAKECWSESAAVAKYNVQKDKQVLKELLDRASDLAKLAKAGEMETTVVVLPASGKATKWSEAGQELRRRQSQAEQVISAVERPAESDAPDAETSENKQDTVFYPGKEAIPACFGSKDSCSTSTGNCSGRGECSNKYANRDGSEGKEVCYVCRCLSTASESGSVTHWAGPTCAKKDVSTAFWLFAGFTLLMVSVLTLSISMLFNVGEEKLPGVIGAGVSKSK
ncbi:uncharacterized protein F5Z01DRAFT_633131 [Emericellopsis atlantica]|uniref:Vacuolar sorting protein Vps3844 C-terminal domain-containing protein n=1 Tax=Emericellopsis atlantica TaxID=2614577 RepID=A0A9P8CT78_9HYPO|nr:uncharacterized protein F5Z01DRAFT_633131 [Emericellopsis atlantica]KAG9258132.1 hypothetical protein F5Z01DRAFT_633131 [Emericellopsis atlantica]